MIELARIQRQMVECVAFGRNDEFDDCKFAVFFELDVSAFGNLIGALSQHLSRSIGQGYR